MKEVEVVGVRLQVPGNQPIVLLREVGAKLYLPVWVGNAEASAIAVAQQGITPPRPLTHDLLLTVIEKLGRSLAAVHVVALVENVFHAELVLDDGTTIPCRTSDAVALALRAGCKVLCDPHVLATGAVAMPDEDEDEVEKFREFLDQVHAEDFGAPPDSE